MVALSALIEFLVKMVAIENVNKEAFSRLNVSAEENRITGCNYWKVINSYVKDAQQSSKSKVCLIVVLVLLVLH